ncbi:hypothetical protein A5684_12300 [Mycobacterium intracellulare]|nr:hypothetical protein A5684_12300 [Mycobacterium intracellulare]
MMLARATSGVQIKIGMLVSSAVAGYRMRTPLFVSSAGVRFRGAISDVSGVTACLDYARIPPSLPTVLTVSALLDHLAGNARCIDTRT